MDFVEKESDTLDVLLHGAGGGMNHTNMIKVFDVCVKQEHSVVSFNFPFFERGEENSSGPDLIEEVETLKKILTECKADDTLPRPYGRGILSFLRMTYRRSIPACPALPAGRRQAWHPRVKTRGFLECCYKCNTLTVKEKFRAKFARYNFISQ
jgi:hypothetical protein